MIQISNYSLKYLDKPVLKNVSMTIKAGQKVAICGENGCGKSTLLKSIVGILKSDDGQILIDNVKNIDLSKDYIAKNIFYLQQDDPSLSIIASELYGYFDKCYTEKIINNAYEFGITKKQIFDTNIKDLSGEERKKVYLSLIFGIDKKWKLLDEPSNFLDENSINILKMKIQKDNNSIIFITHNDDIKKVADDIFMLEKEMIR